MITEQTKALTTELASLRTEQTEIVQQNKALSDLIVGLQAEVQSLRDQLMEKVELIIKTKNESPPLPIPTDALRETLKNTLSEEKVKSEVIVADVEDIGANNDLQFVSGLCSKMEFNTKPQAIMRLKKSQENNDRPRLLKVSFGNPFEARTFTARFAEVKKQNATNLPDIKMRPSRTKAEREIFKKKSALKNRLNEEAKTTGNHNTQSFSLRENGEIWRYVHLQGKWTRDREWQEPAPETHSGNLQSTPRA